MKNPPIISAIVIGSLCAAIPATASTFVFNNGNVDGRMAAASRPPSAGISETETADDFVIPNATQVTGASFTGLLTGGADVSNITDVVVEIYRVFPNDSTNPPSGKVPTRQNSPSDVAFASRDSAASTLSLLPLL